MNNFGAPGHLERKTPSTNFEIFALVRSRREKGKKGKKQEGNQRRAKDVTLGEVERKMKEASSKKSEAVTDKTARPVGLDLTFINFGIAFSS